MKKEEIVILTVVSLTLILVAIILTKEITLQNICDEKGGLFLKNKCVKVEFLK